jgi:TPR repeat protein
MQTKCPKLFLMKRLLVLLLPILLLSCRSSPERINADLRHLHARAERNDRRAQWELGDAYMKLGNWPEANKWLRQAAERGVVEAQYQLGRNYETATGIQRDLVEAYAWNALAAEQGLVMAMNARERLSRLLSHDQLEEASRRAFAYATKIPGRKEKGPSAPDESK